MCLTSACRYDGKDVDLTPDQEELATFYAGIPKDGPQLGNPKTAKIFNRNFFADFKEALGKDHVVQKLELCNFEAIRAHLDAKKAEVRGGEGTVEGGGRGAGRHPAAAGAGTAVVERLRWWW